MIRRAQVLGRLRGRSLAGATLAAIATAALVLSISSGAASSAQVSAQQAQSIPQTDDALPLGSVTMIGSSPQEAPDETWGIGKGESGAYGLVRYTPESGWTLGPPLLDSAGQPLQGFSPDASGLGAPSPLAGQITAGGAGALVGTVEKGAKQVLLTRNPGGAFQQTAPVEETLLTPEEHLFSGKRAPVVAPLEEANGQAGALIVPEGAGSDEDVLHWDGQKWTREAIEVPAGSTSFDVLGIGASSPQNAWLIAQPSSESETLTLYRRIGDAWQPVAPAAGEAPGAPLTVKGDPLRVAGGREKLQTQLITVTAEGVWIDGQLSESRELATAYFKPEGPEGLEGKLTGSWCAAGCEHALPEDLPEDLPNGASRSIAWANPSTPYGERVITGLGEGVSLRLEGSEFRRVLALGGSLDPGGAFGAAFANPAEGWLGAAELPVHLTPHPEQSNVKPWPVPFRHALFAIAPAPGVPAGALSSEALAVGDLGEVARYVPGEGWIPESLLGPGGRVETPRLRAVAWPTPTRAYAVGDWSPTTPSPQMWLWRAETKLWEPDPAIPLDFRGSLLGIAFDPGEPAVGYAVGTHGVFLRYGKTWTQEALPAAAAGANFTSIAFAGSEAIVAFNRNPERGARTGGLLVNNGSGWQIDEGAAQAMGSSVPVAVAGLPDGGAAVAVASEGGGAKVFERNAQGEAWQATPVPFPPGSAPGSLALFREGEALRVIASGVAAIGEGVVTEPPPGFPPPLEEPTPVPTGLQQQRGVVRQTADGWSDQEHELDPASEPVGAYTSYDVGYEPDPVDAMLVTPSGSEGWAVGGIAEEHEALDTADAERYEANPAEQPVPPGITEDEHIAPRSSTDAIFAVGGGGQCAAPCADRAEAKIGPDVWLSAAFQRASRIEDVRDFLYTGPRVSKGQTEGGEPPFPFGYEFARYAEILAGSPLHVYAAATPTDLNSRPAGGTEATFLASLGSAQLPQSALAASDELSEAQQHEQENTQGGAAAYYSFVSGEGAQGRVRVIVLDDTADVQPAQLQWLERRLQEAQNDQQPAIVIGNADLNTQIEAHDVAAEHVAEALVKGYASAYFYDSPEENVEEPLRLAGQSTNVKTFGSGTLGYVNFGHETSLEFHGASGFLLAEVGPYGTNASKKGGEVTVQLIPNIEDLALEAENGALLRRGQSAPFRGLARRPRAGNESQRGALSPTTDPYIPIPSNCVGAGCEHRDILPEYTFSSSVPRVGEFVTPNLATSEPGAVLLAADGQTIPDAKSGLFCAYNPGETTVTISAGGLSASLLVTVQAGSPRRPCAPPPGSELPPASVVLPVPPPAPAPTPVGASPAAASSPPVALPPPPAPAVPPVIPHAVRPAAALPPFFVPGVAVSPVLGFVPPPVPTPARPTPPTGTSAVTSPVEVAEREEEHEEAPESVSNQAVAYRAPEQGPPAAYILGIVVLAAFAGAAVRGRPRRGRRELPVALATIDTRRAERTNRRGRP